MHFNGGTFDSSRELKQQFEFQTRSDTNRTVLSQKQARNFEFRKKRNSTIRVAKTKALISFAVTAPLFSLIQIVGFLMRRLIYRKTAHFVDSAVNYSEYFMQKTKKQ